LDRFNTAESEMANCRLCGFECGVNRLAGPAGVCRAGATSRVFRVGIDHAGEKDIVPTLVVNFSGCNFRCSFCVTGQHSQNARNGRDFEFARIAREVKLNAGKFISVTIEGGEAVIHLPSVLRFISEIPDCIPLVWKTNAYSSSRALKLLDGLFEIILADYKFGNDECAAKIAIVPNYTKIIQQNLEWAQTQPRLIIRHLLMPGHFDCCSVPVLKRIAAQFPGAEVSLLTSYVPAFRARRSAELNRFATAHEVAQLKRLSKKLGLKTIGIELAECEPVEINELGQSEVWIDNRGNIRTGLLTSPLHRCVQRISDEMKMGI
jgi:putative pyruvate formate lyase activating enzyme